MSERKAVQRDSNVVGDQDADGDRGAASGLRATLDAPLPRAGEITALTRQTRQVLFIARGTSDNAAVYGSYLVQVRGPATVPASAGLPRLVALVLVDTDTAEPLPCSGLNWGGAPHRQRFFLLSRLKL